MVSRIIIQGRPFTIAESGNKSFTTSFIACLARKLPSILFDILVPSKVISSDFDLPKNVTFTILEPVKTEPEYLSTLLWENQQVYDYVLAHSNEETIFLSTHHSLPIKKLNIPAFVILHDVHLWSNPDKNWSIERKLAYQISEKSISNADYIFTVSNFTKKKIAEHFSTDHIAPIQTIYEDINISFQRLIDSKQPDSGLFEKNGLNHRNYFLYIGSFEVRKNVPMLLQAYESYSKQSTIKRKLVLFGGHTTRSKEIGGFSINNKDIIHFENLTTKDIIWLYKNAFAFTYPSLYEGFGLQIIEAQRTHCPLLLSDIPVFREIAGDGALYFDPQSSEEIARKMVCLEEHPDLRSDLINRGEENQVRFSWDNTVSDFIDKIKSYL